jgi:hypothetical protein
MHGGVGRSRFHHVVKLLVTLRGKEGEDFTQFLLAFRSMDQ